MYWLSVVLVVPLVCFVMAYGTQKRTRWAWYGGWVFGFFAAGAVCNLAMGQVQIAESLAQWVVALVFTAGGVCIWTFWAVWWSTHREAFLRKKTPEQ